MGKRVHSKPSLCTRQMIKDISALEDPEHTDRSLTIEPYDGVGLMGIGEGDGRRNYGKDAAEEEGQRKEIRQKMNEYSQPEKGRKERISKDHRYKKNSKLKKSNQKIRPEKLTFAANFTTTDKTFDVTVRKRIGMFASMHEDVDITREPDFQYNNLDKFESMMVNPSDNPTYEDPKDVLDRRTSKRRSESDSSKMLRDGKAMLKEQKKKLAKKYESLIIGLMDRCEENTTLLVEKQSQLQKMKEKLKLLLAYNEQFAEENERLRRQQSEASVHLAQCPVVTLQLETRNRELEKRLGQLEVPSREDAGAEVKLVEMCMACNRREIALRHVEQRNAALQRDMTAMKDVIYRLNIQLSRYQEKLRMSRHDQNKENNTSEDLPVKDCSDALKNSEDKVNYSNIFESLNNANLQGITAIQAENTLKEDLTPDPKSAAKRNESPADLNANALAPLFEAYQESIREKDNLILDYEKQFSNLNQRMKQLLQNNKALTGQFAVKTEELNAARESLKRTAAERESAELDKVAFSERTEKAEIKLKEVYELYEDKVAAMSRDYETVHSEYFACRHALARAERRLADLAAGGARTVPADLHERSLHDLKRLFEELKYQYGVERERREAEVARLRARNTELEAETPRLRAEESEARFELKAALKNVRLYRRAAVVFRARLRACAASANSMRRRRARLPPPPPPLAALSPDMRAALEKVDRIKAEIQAVKATAYGSLAAVERRMRAQQAAAARAADEHARDLQRAQLLLDHKEGIIRSLIERVADVEELRLNEVSNHRLQGIPMTPVHLRRQEAGKSRQEGTRRQDVRTVWQEPRRPELRRQDAGAFRQDDISKSEARVFGMVLGVRQEEIRKPEARKYDTGANQKEEIKRPEIMSPQSNIRKQGSVRLVPAPGGYFQEAKDDRKHIGS